MDVIFLGNRAPYVKDNNVVQSINIVWIGVLINCDMDDN